MEGGQYLPQLIHFSPLSLNFLGDLAIKSRTVIQARLLLTVPETYPMRIRSDI